MTNFEKLYIELLDDKYAKGMEEGENRGRKEGEAKGRRIGEEQGRKIGMSQGITQGIIQVAKEMIKNKMKDSDILKVTHISKEELEKMKKEA